MKKVFIALMMIIVLVTAGCGGPTQQPIVNPDTTETPTATPEPSKEPEENPAPTPVVIISPEPSKAPEPTPTPTNTPKINPEPSETQKTSPNPTTTPKTTPEPSKAPEPTPTPTPTTPSPTPTPAAPTPPPASTGQDFIEPVIGIHYYPKDHTYVCSIQIDNYEDYYPNGMAAGTDYTVKTEILNYPMNETEYENFDGKWYKVKIDGESALYLDVWVLNRTYYTTRANAFELKEGMEVKYKLTIKNTKNGVQKVYNGSFIVKGV